MDYTYLIERKANKNLDRNDLDTSLLYILCYRIETECKYPFLQFMMEKIPFCNNLIKEQFVLPHIIINNNTISIKTLALEKIKKSLQSIGYTTDNLTDNMYKGILLSNDLITPYVLVNISDIRKSEMLLYRNSSIWFILPSEIINTKEVCSINISNEVTQLFTEHPHLGILTNPKTKNIYILPDAVYTGGEYKSVEFNSIFGNKKTKPYEMCDEYFYFYRSFRDAIRDGGWFNNATSFLDREGEREREREREIFDNEYNRYIKGGINRYALFLEGDVYIEMEQEFSLTDVIIEKMYPDPCIVICYSLAHEIKPDILVKDYDNFASLSYHIMNKTTLDDIYMYKNNKQYSII